MVGRGEFEDVSKGWIGRVDVVCNADEEGVRMGCHVVIVGLYEICLEKPVFEMPWEAFYEEFGVCRSEEGL